KKKMARTGMAPQITAGLSSLSRMSMSAFLEGNPTCLAGALTILFADAAPGFIIGAASVPNPRSCSALRALGALALRQLLLGPRRFLRVLRLVKLHREVARHFEMGDEAIALIGDGLGELDAALLQ